MHLASLRFTCCCHTLQLLFHPLLFHFDGNHEGIRVCKLVAAANCLPILNFLQTEELHHTISLHVSFL